MYNVCNKPAYTHCNMNTYMYITCIYTILMHTYTYSTYSNGDGELRHRGLHTLTLPEHQADQALY